ncbi:hypothetical protein JCM5296_003567 [Sporobolomyces johnsonii]
MSEILWMLRQLQILGEHLFFCVIDNVVVPFDDYEVYIEFIDQLGRHEDYSVDFIIEYDRRFRRQVTLPDGLVASLKSAGCHDPIFGQVSRTWFASAHFSSTSSSSASGSFGAGVSGSSSMQRTPSTGKAPRQQSGPKNPDACRKYNLSAMSAAVDHAG